MTKTKRQIDPNASKRLADFVRGRKGIPREQVAAAFPKVAPQVLAVLHALGYIEGDARGDNGGNFRAYHEAKREERKAAKVAKLEAELAKLRTPTAG